MDVPSNLLWARTSRPSAHSGISVLAGCEAQQTDGTRTHKVYSWAIRSKLARVADRELEAGCLSCRKRMASSVA
ncbi:hypothetical protein N656DRAFT_772949 [Canariomyces notabilis]|uniref:Uncharacterized protein n=1 Tax=Canariomyces notabilis TaxID=2074819 RepID=A0AAN6TM31_9PEZI|nr:hypothetical protein N656DRAFT_772949 [Canariomyces arenarius]